MNGKSSASLLPVLASGLITVLHPCTASPVEADSIRTGAVQIIGDLGLPLGTPTKVDATIVSLEAPYGAGGQFHVYRLRIHTINGVAVAKPKIFEFWAEDEQKSLLASTPGDLETLLSDLVAGRSIVRRRVTEQETAQLRDSYTKITRQLVVYECAKFVGRPENLPDAKPASNVPSFRFSTFLVVVQPERSFVETMFSKP